MVDYGLKNKVAVITGANNPQGIGAATALAFAREGAKVVLVYKKLPRPFDASRIEKNGVDRYFAANAGNAVYAAYGSKTGDAYATTTTTKKGAANLLDDSKEYAAGNSAYAAILYTYGSGDDLQFMGNVGKVTFESAMNVESAGMSLNLLGTSSTPTAWSTAAVPEPTSGLLLLLGMAGLALKRKRA